MKILAIIFGIIVTILGLANYVATDMSSFRAVMPAVWGAIIVLLGILQGRWPHRHSLYGTLLLSVFIILGSLRSVWQLFTLITSGGEDPWPQTVIIRSVIALLCVVYIILIVNLYEYFFSGWKAFGHFMGDMLARVVLTIFYFSVFLPFGIGVTLFGDPLKLKSKPVELWQQRSTGDQKLEEVLRQF